LEFAKHDRVAVVVANDIFGAAGTTLIAVMIMISTFGCNNGLILAGARVYYSMAKDGLFFKKAGDLNKNAVPEYALWIQSVVACLLCLSGRYGDLLTMVSFVVVIFYVFTIVGIFILRKKAPDADRPYKAFGYPVLPVIYILLAIGFCAGLVWVSPKYSLWGAAIALIGIPLYYIALRNKKGAA
jgi:APA family basic amino acid/polyamine antiporter